MNDYGTFPVIPASQSTRPIPGGVIFTGQPEGSLHRPVTIKKVANGYIIEVGCKTFVESSWMAVCEGLDLYWRNPKAAERKYCTD